MRVALFSIVLLCSAANAAEEMPSHCAASEQVIFNCQIKNSVKVLSLCASPQLTKKVGYVQYRFGPVGKVELEFPKDRKKTQEKFFFASYSRYQVSRNTVNFKIGSYEYSVFSSYEGDEDPPIAESGVSVGKTNLSCSDPITNELFKLREVVACDIDDALNMGSCPE